MDNKKLICLHLERALKNTRMFNEDLRAIEYKKIQDTEVVDIILKNGYIQRVNVTADSGMAMISDIIKSIF